MSQAIKIERLEELRLTAEIETEISVLLDKAFPVDYHGRSFFQNRHHCRFLHRSSDKRLVGHLAIAYRAIHMGKTRVDIIGIADVAVAKQHQNRGIGSALVSAAIAEGKRAKADFAALFGENPIYTKVGFQPAPNLITISEMEGSNTGSIVRENNKFFKVKQLGSIKWDIGVDVDLAGFAF